MEHSFRIAIWMLLLLGFLQARPAPALDELIDDFGLALLRDDVSCNENVTFASPAVKMMGDCLGYSLEVMKDGLERAKENCTVTNDRVTDTLTALNLTKTFYPMETSSDCTSQEAGNWMQFLTGCESFFQCLKSKQ